MRDRASTPDSVHMLSSLSTRTSRPLGRELGLTLLAALLLPATSCIEIPAIEDIFVRGEPFVITGVSVLVEHNGPCAAWLGDNGITYHLFQGVNVVNSEFDRVMATGIRSRLVLATRSDLEIACQVGRLVEVQAVFEIWD